MCSSVEDSIECAQTAIVLFFFSFFFFFFFLFVYQISFPLFQIRERPIKSVSHFAKILRTEKTMLVPKHLDPATLGFQALRMTVNREVPELIAALRLSARVLKRNGGVLVFVSYHSIEDRIVKKFIQLSSPQKDKETPCLEKNDDFVRPDENEVSSNPKASSATLRYAYRNNLPYTKDVTENLESIALKRRV